MVLNPDYKRLDKIIITLFSLYMCIDLYIGAMGVVSYLWVYVFTIFISALSILKIIVVQGKIPITKYAVWWMLFFFLIIISQLINNCLQTTLILRWIVLLLFMLSISSDKDSFDFGLKIIVFSAIIQTIGLIWEAVGFGSWYNFTRSLLINGVDDFNLQIITKSLDVGYLTGFTHNAGFAATYIINGLIALLLLKDKLIKGWYYLLFAFFFIGLLLTGKRGQLIILIASYLIIWILQSRDIKKALITIVTIAFLIIILYFTGLYLYTNNKVPTNLQRIFKLIYLNNGTDKTSGRLILWSMAMRLFHKNPIIGIGWLHFPEYNFSSADPHAEVHNTYLQVLCETGIVGFISYVLMMIKSVLSTLKEYFTIKRFSGKVDFSITACLLYMVYFLIFAMIENAMVHVEPLFMLVFVLTYLRSVYF